MFRWVFILQTVMNDSWKLFTLTCARDWMQAIILHFVITFFKKLCMLAGFRLNWKKCTNKIMWKKKHVKHYKKKILWWKVMNYYYYDMTVNYWKDKCPSKIISSNLMYKCPSFSQQKFQNRKFYMICDDHFWFTSQL